MTCMAALLVCIGTDLLRLMDDDLEDFQGFDSQAYELLTVNSQALFANLYTIKVQLESNLSQSL